MRDIRDNVVIQLVITSGCELECQGCTQMVQFRKPDVMNLETFERGIDSLDGWPGQIGIFGGSPTMHKQFRLFMDIYRAKVPKDRRALWCTDFKWKEYESLIKDTFLPDRIHFNNHVAYDGRHKPLLVAIEEAVDDPVLRRQLIENCPYQAKWSASITPRGCYACEIAGALDALFDLGIAWPIEPGWWKRTVSDYEPMIEAACSKCSGAIPMEARSDGRGGRDPVPDLVSPGNLVRLERAGSRHVAHGRVEVFDGKITPEAIEAHKNLNPRAFRSFVAHSPEDVPCEPS